MNTEEYKKEDFKMIKYIIKENDCCQLYSEAVRLRNDTDKEYESKRISSREGFIGFVYSSIQ